MRKIASSAMINDYVNFPHVGQVFRIERSRTNIKTGACSFEIAYGITSLTPEKANAKTLLKLSRGHWEIENSLHWVRDVVYDEDRSQVRTGAGPRVLASLRNTAISLLHLNGLHSIAGSLRKNCFHPERTLQLVGL
ncbi:ISAs1 family transposase [Syntrophothermus sp.]|uniref:ISAs1 family transposase n=1 Tax=Syntrophothermus sp. TaxID=2736299 RepID=UPI00338DA8B9